MVNPDQNPKIYSIGEGLRPTPLSVPEPSPSPPSFGLDQLLEVMRAAQDLEVGSPSSGETGVVLESILKLLELLSPQFELRILLFNASPLAEVPTRVFSLADAASRPAWLGERAHGQSSFLPLADLIPETILESMDPPRENFRAFAIPLHEPTGASLNKPNEGPTPEGIDFRQAQEVGLLFLLAREEWPLETALALGAKLSHFITHRWFVHREVNRKIHIDALTCLYNRGYLDGHLPLLMARAKRSKGSLALIVADVDIFKSINSKFGLTVGDQVLQMVARQLRSAVRQVDVVCRRGGEEFALILPETGFEAAREVITRLLNTPMSTEVMHNGQKTTISVTLSYGVSIYPDNAIDHDQLHFQAESTMLFSKDRGRNRCHFFSNDGDHLQQLPGEVFSDREQA